MEVSAQPRLPLAARLWIYQAERFPLVRTLPMLAVFSAASVTASAHLGQRPLPALQSYAVALVLVLVFFWQLRAADEVKDADLDRRFRPERPVPRGLVSLRLIAGLAVLAALPAAIAAWWLATPLLLLIGLVWGFLALMTVEFFARDRLRASPTLTLVTHMPIMPLIDLALTGCEWLPAAALPPAGLWTFLWMSFCNGCVVEFGRKTWAPRQERAGVETYSSSWGLGKALGAICVAAAGAFAGLIAFALYAGHTVIMTSCGGAALAILIFVARGFWQSPTPAGQKRLEAVSGLWVMACYLSAALVPLLPTTWR